MKKITIIHGQNHKGSTYHIGRMLAEKILETENQGHAEPKGPEMERAEPTGEKEPKKEKTEPAGKKEAEIKEFFLPRDLPYFCQGCYTCIDDDTGCPYYEEKQRIMKEVEESDILIFTTPTYCMHASAPMMAFIDLTFTYWMSHRPRKCMFDKKAVVISTAAGAGAKGAVKDIKGVLTYWGVPYIKTYGIAVQAAGWNQVKEKKKQKIRSDISRLAGSVSKAKVRVGIKTRGLFYLMRMMQKNNMGSGPIERAYWEKNGWLGKNRPWKS